MRIQSILFGLLLSMLSVTSMAGPTKETDTYRGMVDHVSIKGGQIIVNDHVFRLLRNFEVRNARGKSISAFNLRKGTRVELHLDKAYQVFAIDILK